MAFRSLRESIQTRINLMIGAVVGLVLLTLGAFDTYDMLRQSAERERLAAELSTERLANELAVHVHDYDRDAIRHALGIAMRDRTLFAATIHDAVDGSVILRMKRGGDWTPLETSDDLTVSTVDKKRFAFPISQNGKSLGMLEAYFTDDFARAHAWREVGLRIAMFAVVLLAAMLAMATTLSRFVLRPLKGLQETLRQITEGRLDAVVDTSRGDEIGDLARGFEAMRSSIQEKIRVIAESELRFRSLVEHAADAVLVYDSEGRIVDVNTPACQSLGYKRQELLGLKFESLKRDAEPEFIRKDGSTFPVELRSGSFYVRDARLLFSFVRDVTEQRRTEAVLRENEAQKRHSQKMEAIGQLAGGIAHDFNNLLTAIIGSADLLRLLIPPEPKLKKLVSVILQSADRSATLTKQLLTFSRKAPLTVDALDINGVVRDGVLPMVELSLDKRIEVRCDLDPDAALVLGDRASLENALLNLVVNARDAMPEGGVLTIRSRRTIVGETSCHVRFKRLRPGRHVELEIEDTGTGIAPEIMQRVFEPYFTTKPVGRGTGLGLSSVFGCVESHRGEIVLESEVGVGTTFRILLPELDDRTDAVPVEEVVPVSSGGRLLVIDDEQSIRDFVKSALEGLDYKVDSCEDGPKGISRLRDSDDAYDLVILDLVMPQMSGQDVLREIRRINPTIKVLLTSGYAEEGAIVSAMGYGAAGFLTKPFKVVDLSRQVAQALEGRAT